MASNDPEPDDEPKVPDQGPVAYLTRVIHDTATNDQTPIRVGLMILIALSLAATPIPWNGVGFASLVLLALSLGRITPTRK
jgi:hypothetical protein